jgi:hypothetical protein
MTRLFTQTLFFHPNKGANPPPEPPNQIKSTQKSNRVPVFSIAMGPSCPFKTVGVNQAGFETLEGILGAMEKWNFADLARVSGFGGVVSGVRAQSRLLPCFGTMGGR